MASAATELAMVNTYPATRQKQWEQWFEPMGVGQGCSPQFRSAARRPARASRLASRPRHKFLKHALRTKTQSQTPRPGSRFRVDRVLRKFVASAHGTFRPSQPLDDFAVRDPARQYRFGAVVFGRLVAETLSEGGVCARRRDAAVLPG